MVEMGDPRAVDMIAARAADTLYTSTRNETDEADETSDSADDTDDTEQNDTGEALEDFPEAAEPVVPVDVEAITEPEDARTLDNVSYLHILAHAQ